MITYSRLGQCGRLGNQLWQIASTLGIAYMAGERAGFTKEWDYRPYFSLPDEYFPQWPGPRGSEIPIEQAHQTPWANCMAPQEREYLQDYRLWKDYKGKIWEYFQPSPLAMEKLESYDLLKIVERPALSLHVRRGDNAQAPNNYHPLRPLSYYRQAPFLLDKQFASVVVFSDDIPWCKENLGDLEAFWPMHFFEGGKPRKKEHERGYKTDPFDDWIDLLMMSRMDRHVISNSTYSWWGAFLSHDPAPIYPWPYFGSLLEHVDCEHMFPEHWIRFDHGQQYA